MNGRRYPEQYSPDKTICKWRWSYPVIHISRGEIRTCDKPVNIRLTEEMFQQLGTDAFINNPYLKERRLEKLQGFKHSDCFTCIKLEERGIQSSRSGQVPFMEYMKNVVGRTETFEEMTSNIPEELLRADNPDILEISLSNLCNLKCIYCSSTFSTAWEDEDIKQGFMSEDRRESKQFLAPPSMEKYFWEWYQKIEKSLNRVIFIGGEPLFNEKLYEYLDRIVELTSDRPWNPMWINIITNFNAPDKYFDRLLERIKTAPKNFMFHIEASGESVGERTEYIREGLRWAQYTRNVEKLLALRLPHVYFGFQIAVNALCVTSLKDLFQYAFDLQKRFNLPVDFKQNIVVHPEHLSPYILTPDFADKMDEAIAFVRDYLANPDQNHSHFGYMASFRRWQEILPFLESISRGIRNAGDVRSLQKQFASFVATNDRVRNRNFRTTFPEYRDFLNHCESLP